MQDPRTIKKRFLTLNRDRLKRMSDSLRSRQWYVIDTVPLLFHVNHPAIPGFVSEATPMGIADYTPANRTVDALAKAARGFSYKRRALPRYDLFSLFLMGSSGTIAYSSDSDFDIWLCYNPDLAAEQIAELQQKAAKIEKWANGHGIEMHFFLMNTEDFRKGNEIELTDESSGSTQHHLLLDEFYRTGLLLAGRYPLWWLIPPGEQIGYEAYAQRLVHDGVVRTNETIDFGNLPKAPAEEFFGAALWQLYKSIDSPYKAALKLILMEVYAAEYPDVELLSQCYKRAIHEGETDLTCLDPYIMLYNKIEAYLKGIDDEDRLAVIRRCFYFKVNEQLGMVDRKRSFNWRVEVMKELTGSWGWTREYMHMLDNRRRWKIHQVLEERQSLVNALTRSYQLLSRFAREQNMLAKINQNDLNVLGRKLYAAFERKAGKIDIINQGISDEVWENQLYLYHAGNKDRSGWILYRDVVKAENSEQNKPLKRSRSILEMLAWCHLNQLIYDRTTYSLHARDSQVTLSEVKAIAKCLEQFFPKPQLEPCGFETLSEAPKLSKAAFFINIGQQAGTLRMREGKFLTSNKSDALSYGGICENLVLSIDQLMQTSWQEVLTSSYEGEKGLFDCLSAYLQWSPPSTATAPPPVSVYCFSTNQGMSIARRIEELFTDVIDCYYKDNPHYAATRYIVRVGRTFHALAMEDDGLTHTSIGSYDDLIRYLSRPSSSYSPICVDRYALDRDILPMIYRNNKPDVIQVYYTIEENRTISLYFVDERGSLFHRSVSGTDLPLLINHYRRFFRAVIARQNMHPAKSAGNERKPEIEFYQAHRKSHGMSALMRHSENTRDESGASFNLQVITSVSENDRPEYTIYINDREFSTIEFGDALYQHAAQHILNLRKSGQRYPIYITDVDLSYRIAGVKSPDQLQTVHYLEYKKKIEDRLNVAFSSMVENYAAELGSQAADRR